MLKRLFYLQWINKYESQKVLYRFLLYSCIILSVLFIWILMFVIPFIYIGIILKRKEVIKELKERFNNKIKNHYINYALRILLLITLILLILMIFPIPIMIMICIGHYIESRKDKIKTNINPYAVEQNFIDKRKDILSSGRI